MVSCCQLHCLKYIHEHVFNWKHKQLFSHMYLFYIYVQHNVQLRITTNNNWVLMYTHKYINIIIYSVLTRYLHVITAESIIPPPRVILQQSVQLPRRLFDTRHNRSCGHVRGKWSAHFSARTFHCTTCRTDVIRRRIDFRDTLDITLIQL